MQGREALNRAVDGDVVAVELLPEDEWTSPSGIVLEDKEVDPTDDAIATEDETEKLVQKGGNKEERQPTGKVVGVIKRKWRQYCGIIQPNILQGSARHIFVPAERKIPRVRIETRQAEKLYNQRIIVAIDQWPRHSRYPQGHFVRSLGPLGDKDTENEVLLIEHDVPHSKFSEEVLSCLPKLPWIISSQVILFFIHHRHPNQVDRLLLDHHDSHITISCLLMFLLAPARAAVRHLRYCDDIPNLCGFFFLKSDEAFSKH